MPDPIVEVLEEQVVLEIVEEESPDVLVTEDQIVVVLDVEQSVEALEIGVVGPQGPPGSGAPGNNDVGVLYLKDNATPTTIPSVNGRSVVAGTTQVGELFNFIKDPGTNSLKYTGPGGRFHIIATFSFYGGSQKTCGFYIGVNRDDNTALNPSADRISESEIYINAGTQSNQPKSGAIQTVRELDPDDRVFFIVQNKDTTDSITVEFLKLVVVSLTAEKGDQGDVGPQGETGPQGEVGPPGQDAPSTLAALDDVNVNNKVSKSILYYDAASGKWKGDSLQTVEEVVNGGNF